MKFKIVISFLESACINIEPKKTMQKLSYVNSEKIVQNFITANSSKNYLSLVTNKKENKK